jgi:hypothetical protein
MPKYLSLMIIFALTGFYEFHLSFDHRGIFYTIAPPAFLIGAGVFGLLWVFTSGRPGHHE